MAVEFVYLAQYHIVKRDSLSYNLLYLSVFLTTPLSFMGFFNTIVYSIKGWLMMKLWPTSSLSGGPDYFYRNKISSGGDLSHYSSASLY